jgi:hypothetical protein
VHLNTASQIAQTLYVRGMYSVPAIMPICFFMLAWYGSFMMGPLQSSSSPTFISSRCLDILPDGYTFTTRSKNPLKMLATSPRAPQNHNVGLTT